MSAPMDILDAQVHISLELDERALLASMDALGVRSALLDELWHVTPDFRGMPCAPLGGASFRPLSPYAQAAALRNPERFSYLQRVDRHDPQISSLIALLGSSPGARAVRVLLFGREDRAAFGEGGHDEILAAAREHELAVCVLGPDIATLSAVIHRFPGLSIVLDHCGWARSLEHWEQVLSAASLEGVVLKWCHAARVFGTDERALAEAQLQRAIAAFGPERVMWAGDVTEERSGAGWGELLAAVTQHGGLSAGDQEWLLARTARTVFNWPAAQLPEPLTAVEQEGTSNAA